MLWASFEKDSFNYSETRAETIANLSAEPSEKYLELFGNDIALNIYYTFLDHTPLGDMDRVGSSISQPTRLNRWPTAVVTCLAERVKRGDHRQ